MTSWALFPTNPDANLLRSGTRNMAMVLVVISADVAARRTALFRIVREAMVITSGRVAAKHSEMASPLRGLSGPI